MRGEDDHAPFHTYDVALQLARAMRPLIERMKRMSSEVADQAERAVTSVVLNIAEGNRRDGRDPRRFFVIAQGSVCELAATLDLADVWQWGLDDRDARALIDRQRALLWRLTHRRA